MSASIKFGTERALENFIVQRWSTVCTFLGIDLLLIGRQVRIVPERRIDLLAIDNAGRLYIIELKLDETPDTTTAQIMEYRQRLNHQTRKQLVSTLRTSTLRVDLERAFEDHFNRSFPPTTAMPPAIVAIAREITPRVANSFLELLEHGYPISVFTYTVVNRTLQLNRVDEEGLMQAGRMRKLRRRASDTPARHSSDRPGVAVEWFWAMQSQQFRASLVAFRTIWASYERWHAEQVSAGLQLPRYNSGQFGRRLKSIIESSGDWEHVYIAAGTEPDPRLPTAELPPYVRNNDARHTNVAYLRTTTHEEYSSSASHIGRIRQFLGRNLFFATVLPLFRSKQFGAW